MGATKYEGAEDAGNASAPYAQEVMSPMSVYEHIIAQPRTANVEPSDPRAFLSYFPDARKSWVTNLFLFAVREGADTVDAVYTAVDISLLDKLHRAAAYRDKEQHAKLDEMLYYFEHFPEEARAFARWALDWERLSPEEKVRIKAQKSAGHIKTVTQGQPPTERQIAYCRSLGHTGPITSKAHASEIIEMLKGGVR